MVGSTSTSKLAVESPSCPVAPSTSSKKVLLSRVIEALNFLIITCTS